jgi:hypothetical protein
MTEPENIVLQLLREMRAEMNSEFADVRSGVQSLRADVASDLLTTEKRLAEQIVGLRRAVMEYHSSAIGHGVRINEFEERLRRIEQRLNINDGGSH